MLKITEKKNTIEVETMSGKLVFDAACGGQICKMEIKNESARHSVVDKGMTLHDIEMMINGKRLRLSSVRANIEVTKKEKDFCRIMTIAHLHDAAIVTQEYEVHEEGVVFCNFAVDTPSGIKFDLGECYIIMRVDLSESHLARWGCYTRQPKYKRDYSTVHAFSEFSMYKKLDERIERRELLPYFSVSVGWGDTKFFSNHMEFLMEDWTSYNDGPLSLTKTIAGGEGKKWEAIWYFHEGATVTITGSYRYRNRWGFLFGRGRNRAGAGVDPAVRNNVLGAKICHCMYPYAREGDRWPWVSMPIKQVAVQKPQFFKGNPELKRVDEAKSFGADIMVIHQFWMKNPGSNNEPNADYQPFDPKWLKAFVNRCHKFGMRVVFYVRGTEQWQHYSSFFEDFLKKDWDGLYSDWNSPFAMGYLKCSPLHVSAHNYFHFTKAQRNRVGNGGILIGHTGNANYLSSACFDAAIGGEFSVRHDELLADPESTAYFAHLACVGGELISGNLPDRVMFSSPKAQAVCAAFGMMSHPFMEPGVTFAERLDYIKPLWDSLNKLPGKIVELHNPAYIPTKAIYCEEDNLYPSLFISDKKKGLLLITNLADNSDQSGTVEVRLKELNLAKGAKVVPLKINRTFNSAIVNGTAIRIKKIPPLQFAAFLIG